MAARPHHRHEPRRKRALSARRKLTLVALVLSGLSSGPPPAAAEASSAQIAEAVERAYRPLLKEYDVPGLAVAVTRDGQSAVFTFGLADREVQRPVTRDTLFEIGSVSKTFTATLAAYARALGRLSLEDAPGRFLPSLRGSALDRVSLLELGTYTAGGLPLQFPDGVAEEAAMIAWFRDWQPSAPPGTQRRYSNPSLGLFGAAAAAALGGNFTDLMETRLFPKLGFRNTFIRIPEAEMDRYAWGYGKGDRPIRVNPGVLDAEAYGVKSSAADMIRFVEANLDPGRLDPPLRQAVEGTHVGYFRVGAMVQGLGWEQYPYPVSLERLQAGHAPAMTLEAQPAARLDPPQVPSGPTLFNKTGSTNGFGAYVAFVPDKRIGLVMLANRAVPIPARIAAAHAVLEVLAEAP
ncbi:beta-lactamase [Methylorubrum populi BJ001]|jgi:beta-lactamase class C|uniref:Beta-lactamase n=1 Tax=Methylorubrum populi (strain ATCC BAA-705 / NCIMB 13946 / BJ001) TaxID=441620 RepID=B1ZF74_METPB|nr:class C beta-lactamase [Methylorubrum populi]ACB79647.1 beta-lactamase [Methylorubrum populi BJ001]OAH38690.1 class C beta-lactamase [Methylorubrum populi]PZP70476.1 MAG: class C beta-lactamase [Methylorubrum populi]